MKLQIKKNKKEMVKKKGIGLKNNNNKCLRCTLMSSKTSSSLEFKEFQL